MFWDWSSPWFNIILMIVVMTAHHWLHPYFKSWNGKTEKGIWTMEQKMTNLRDRVVVLEANFAIMKDNLPKNTGEFTKLVVREIKDNK